MEVRQLKKFKAVDMSAGLWTEKAQLSFWSPRGQQVSHQR